MLLLGLYGKTCNISDDESNLKVVDTGLFKKLISGEIISAEFKGENRFEFPNVATLLISFNGFIHFKDNSPGLTRRLNVIPFNKIFNSEDKDFHSHIEEELCIKENLQYIIFKGIGYFSEVLRNGKFTIPNIVKETTAKYLLENNQVKQFVKECYIRRDEVLEVQGKYEIWRKETGNEKLSSKQLGSELQSLGFKRIRGTTGDRKYFYVAPDYNEEEEGYSDRTVKLTDITEPIFEPLDPEFCKEFDEAMAREELKK